MPSSTHSWTWEARAPGFPWSARVIAPPGSGESWLRVPRPVSRIRPGHDLRGIARVRQTQVHLFVHRPAGFSAAGEPAERRGPDLRLSVTQQGGQGGEVFDIFEQVPPR